jgi:hypothetical protein
VAGDLFRECDVIADLALRAPAAVRVQLRLVHDFARWQMNR